MNGSDNAAGFLNVGHGTHSSMASLGKTEINDRCLRPVCLADRTHARLRAFPAQPVQVRRLRRVTLRESPPLSGPFNGPPASAGRSLVNEADNQRNLHEVLSIAMPNPA